MKSRTIRSSSAGGTVRPAAARPRSIITRAPPPTMLRAGLIGDRRQAFARQDDVEGRDQIGRGIDQRPVEIEDDEGGSHDRRSLAGGGRDGKPTAAARWPRFDYAAACERR